MAKQQFSRKANLNKRNVEKVLNNKPVVYKIQDSKGHNIYTGVAQRGRVQDRLSEHTPKGSDPIPGASSFSVKTKLSIDSARTEEKRIIGKESPKHNKQSK